MRRSTLPLALERQYRAYQGVDQTVEETVALFQALCDSGRMWLMPQDDQRIARRLIGVGAVNYARTIPRSAF